MYDGTYFSNGMFKSSNGTSDLSLVEDGTCQVAPSLTKLPLNLLKQSFDFIPDVRAVIHQITTSHQ